MNHISNDSVSVVLSQNIFFIFSMSWVDKEPMLSMHCDMMANGIVTCSIQSDNKRSLSDTGSAFQMQSFTEELTCAIAVLDDYGQYEDALW